MSAAPLRVLVVDDEPPIRKLLRMGLNAHGYQTLEAPNGKTALEMLKHKPDLVILDLGLPDMQGLDLLSMIRERLEGGQRRLVGRLQLDRIRRKESFSSYGTVKEKGTGLGILLCHQFAEANGGRFYVESEWGKGSRCYFTIPAPPSSSSMSV